MRLHTLVLLPAVAGLAAAAVLMLRHRLSQTDYVTVAAGSAAVPSVAPQMAQAVMQHMEVRDPSAWPCSELVIHRTTSTD